MRHIPEEELHAYLDQALSRAQAVEIESHLAACARCRMERDAIAGLRDRTTALLSTLAPAQSIQRPAWAELRRRHHLATARRARIIRGAVWAASLVAAIGLGYGSHWWLDQARREDLAGPQEALLSPTRMVPAATTVVTPVVALRSPAPRGTGASRSRPIARMEQDTLSNASTLPASGVWRTESLERAVASGLTVPRVAGLPVLQIQVQDAATSSSSLVAVEQVLTGGELVRTIEGPAAEMAALDQNAVASASGDADAPSSVSMRTGNRMLLMTARIPADSLRALLARLRTK
jgi:anti-sigma factor RsiW